MTIEQARAELRRYMSGRFCITAELWDGQGPDKPRGSIVVYDHSRQVHSYGKTLAAAVEAALAFYRFHTFEPEPAAEAIDATAEALATV